MNWLKSISKPVLAALAFIIAWGVAKRVRNHEKKAGRLRQSAYKAQRAAQEVGGGMEKAREHRKRAQTHVEKAEQIKQKAREKAEQKPDSVTARAVADRLNAL